MTDQANVVELDHTQLEAVNLCADMNKRVVGVSGPAGSGKTTIIQQAYDAIIKQGASAVLCAPTGKAARRIKEATGIDAVTIHKLLEYNRPGERDEKTGQALGTTEPKRHRANPLDQKVVFVDEYAMVNHELHNNLLAALPRGGCIRAFGDLAQLLPIERHKVTNADGTPMDTPFQKILKKHEGVVLEKVYRQGEGSGILEMASKVRMGRMPLVNSDLGDFQIKLSNAPVDTLTEFVLNNLDDGIHFGKIENQIIVPGKKTWVGTMKLNQALRNLLNPNPAHSLQLPRYQWDKEPCKVGIGDKVVCTSNTYDMRNFFDRYEQFGDNMMPIYHTYIPCPENMQMLNGETGIVIAINPDGGVEVDFGDRIVEIPETYEEYWAQKNTVINAKPLRDIELAYALTTHKCQGSEFQRVCYVLNKSTQFVQSRQNLYTAMTRARKRVDIITDQLSLKVSVMKVKVS
jgi:exodeoxyribonuclease V alpha subunit